MNGPDPKDIPCQIYHCFKGSEALKSLPQIMKAYDIPGLSLALISDSQITTFEFGFKNTRSQEPVTSTTVFEGASISKPLIAYAALKLCQKGLLDLDRPLSTYLKNSEPNDLYLNAVTLRHILSHTGGFPTANLKPNELLKLEFEPGSRFAYSGESFRYLGKVIEQITGISIASYMQEYVFKPLKMKNSSFVWKKEYDILAAAPHNRKGEPTEKWKPKRAIASFSLHTTATDFAKFMIEARQLPEMSEVNVKINENISWGLGWGVEIDSYGKKGFWHSGDNGTFQCLAFQNEQLGIIIMTNSANGMRSFRELLDLFIGGTHPLLDWERFDSRAAEEQDEDFLANWWRAYG